MEQLLSALGLRAVGVSIVHLLCVWRPTAHREKSDTTAGFEVLYVELLGEAENERSDRIKPVCPQDLRPGRTIPERIHSNLI